MASTRHAEPRRHHFVTPRPNLVGLEACRLVSRASDIPKPMHLPTKIPSGICIASHNRTITEISSIGRLHRAPELLNRNSKRCLSVPDVGLCSAVADH